MSQESLDPHSQLEGFVLCEGFFLNTGCRPECCSHAPVAILKEVLMSSDGNMEAVPRLAVALVGLISRGSSG